MATFIKFSEQSTIKNLIPLHINKCRCSNYFWHWNSNIGDWVRGEKLDDHYKKCIKNPLTKSNY